MILVQTSFDPLKRTDGFFVKQKKGGGEMAQTTTGRKKKIVSEKVCSIS